MEGTKGHLNLILRRLARGHPLEPEAGLDEIPHAPPLSLLVGESDDLISEPCDEGDKDHSRGHFIPEGKVVRDESKDQYAYHHNDEKEARPTSGMKMAVAFHPVGHQPLTGLEGED